MIHVAGKEREERLGRNSMGRMEVNMEVKEVAWSPGILVPRARRFLVTGRLYSCTVVAYGCRNVAKFDKNYFHSIKIYLHSIKIIFIR